MIGIYLNSAGFGGAEMLLIRFCEVLRNKNVAHYVIEDKESFLAKELKKAGTTVISPSEKAPMAQFLFIPYSAMLREALAWAEFIPDAKVLAWIISPNEIFASNFPLMGSALRNFGYRGAYFLSKLLRFHTKNIEVLLSTMCRGQGILLMDGATKRIVNYMFGSSYVAAMPILPIPSPVNFLTYKVSKKKTNILNVGYLGRVEEFKFSALSSFISFTLAKYAKKELVNFHIVGTGPRINDVRAQCRSAGVGLVEYGFQPNDVARKLLVENCELGASMGTAALDLSGSGLPTIIIDPSLRADFRPQENFNFVHEIEEFTLGEYRDFPEYLGQGVDFSSIVEAIIYDENISMRGVNYVIGAHGPDGIFNSLLNYIINSNVSVSDVRGLALRVTTTVEYFKKIYT